MPYGHNVSYCRECHRPYITGDCIELDGLCSECEIDKEVDLSHLVAPVMKEKLKQEIQTIMNDALAGYIDKYKYEADDGKVYVRWGIVQKHINETIDLYWPKEKEDGK